MSTTNQRKVRGGRQLLDALAHSLVADAMDHWSRVGAANILSAQDFDLYLILITTTYDGEPVALETLQTLSGRPRPEIDNVLACFHVLGLAA